VGQTLERTITVEKEHLSVAIVGSKNVVLFKMVLIKFMESLWVVVEFLIDFFWSCVSGF